MKRYFHSAGVFILAFIMALLTTTACSDMDNDWDEAPRPVQNFLSEYFPGQAISDYTVHDGVIYVKLRDSAAISFRTDNCEWISVNGYGNTIPQQFLFDCMPPALYEYLQENEAVGGVYSVSKTATTYTVALLSDTVEYDISTATITYI